MPGRYRIDLDLDLLRTVAAWHVTIVEAAAALKVSHGTLESRLRDTPEVREAWEEGQAKGRMSLRRRQYEKAMEGHPTMLIWMGKQLLGQRDVQAVEHTGRDGGAIEVNTWADLVRAVVTRAGDDLSLQ